MNLNEIVIQFEAKLLEYRVLFKDILTLLGLDYRDGTLKTMNLILIGINIKLINLYS